MHRSHSATPPSGANRKKVNRTKWERCEFLSSSLLDAEYRGRTPSQKCSPTATLFTNANNSLLTRSCTNNRPGLKYDSFPRKRIQQNAAIRQTIHRNIFRHYLKYGRIGIRKYVSMCLTLVLTG